VRQAAHYLEVTEPQYCALSGISNDIPAGCYEFAIYRWAMHGVKPDRMLVAVANDPVVERALLTMLQTSEDCPDGVLPTPDICNTLDGRHHAKWAEAQANHIADNRQLVDHRIQSLTVSHRARCKAIEDQLVRATNEKIKLMKESELGRANADFERRMEELQNAASTGDIRTAPVIFGTLSIAGSSND
jgi:hypothetical protein